MRTIRLGFCGFWKSFNPQKNMFVNILKKYFKVEICTSSMGGSKPDFLICSNRGLPFEYTKYDCVRIMFMGENLSPDFTAFDYVIGFDKINFSDRYFRLPFVFYADNPFQERNITRRQAEDMLAKKKYFCNFIYGHQSSHGMREALFEKLSIYKPVISPGRYLNNCGTNGCTWAEKNQCLIESKFTIAGDSIAYPGFTTEKILDPLRFHSVPVYFGNPNISDEFNPEAFVECKSENDLETVLERVKKIDMDDSEYIKMLMAPMFCKENYLKDLYAELETFLLHIFDQTPEEARRRIRYYRAEEQEEALRRYYQVYKSMPQIVKKVVEKSMDRKRNKSS